MVVGVVKLHVFHPHGRHVLIQNLEAPVFVASREDEGTVVVEDEFVHLHQGGTQVFHVVVPTSVLSHDILEFIHGIAHVIAPVVDGEIHLLVRFVGVYVGIGSHLNFHAHPRFQY